MKILSWDVGIIHLAYCLIEVKDNKNVILDWGNINLLEENITKCYDAYLSPLFLPRYER